MPDQLLTMTTALAPLVGIRYDYLEDVGDRRNSLRSDTAKEACPHGFTFIADLRQFRCRQRRRAVVMSSS